MKQSALMTQYIEGQIVGRELQDLLANEAERARFDKALADEQEFNAEFYKRTHDDEG